MEKIRTKIIPNLKVTEEYKKEIKKLEDREELNTRTVSALHVMF